MSSDASWPTKVTAGVIADPSDSDRNVLFLYDETTGDRTPNPEATAAIFEGAKQRGLLIGKGGLHGNVLRIAPPLTVGADEVDEALATLGEACADLE